MRTPTLRQRQPVEGWEAADWPAHWPAALQRVHAARGSLGQSMALPRLDALPAPDTLLDIGAGVRLLRDAIDNDRHVVVTADFDCDGATACAVAVRGLRMLGVARVSYAVPDRIIHGYGLTPELVETLEPLQPDLVVTVDHGIACHAGVDAAKARGWQVLVTDHHLPGTSLPAADAVIDPNRPDDPFPAKSLAGVGVMFYLLLALRASLRNEARARGDADLASLLDFVAVGTVADMVPLDTVNRALVGAGLRRLRTGQGHAGLMALAAVAGKDPVQLGTADIGFAIGPRINAAGRLDDMRIGIECLLTDDPVHARLLADTLHAINAERRGLQDTMVDAAVESVAMAGASVPLAPCVFDPAWHPGVIGLVASRLKDRLYRPVVAFAPSGNNDGLLRGSARSVAGFHMRDAIARVDALEPGLIQRFGGHAMAAGLTLAEAELPRFQTAFTAVAREWLDPALLDEVLWTDGALDADALDHASALALRDGGAWGQGYPEPVFEGTFEVLGSRIVGSTHLALELAGDGRRLRAIHFGGADGTPVPSSIRIAYRLVPDDYRGGDAVQLVVVHREAAGLA